MSLFQLGVYWECRSKPGGMFPEIMGVVEGEAGGAGSKIHHELSEASQPHPAVTLPFYLPLLSSFYQLLFKSRAFSFSQPYVTV